MELKPQVALDAVVNILQRIPLSPAESVGAQHCVEVVKLRLFQADQQDIKNIEDKKNKADKVGKK